MPDWQLQSLENQLYNRIPLIGGWLRRRAARRLAKGESPLFLRPLAQAFCSHPDRRVREIARQALMQARSQNKIDQICRVWAETRHSELAGILQARGYVAREPANIHVLSALKTGKADHLQWDAQFVPALLDASQDGDPQIAFSAQHVLESLSQPASREAVCRAVIEQDHPTARQVALRSGYLPQAPIQRAMFLFLTGAQAAYQELDFDGRLLRAAYQDASASLRQRILEQIRSTGQVGMLNAIAGHEISVLTVDEAFAQTRLWIEHGEWQRLWEKAFELPFQASLHVVKCLGEQDWRPTTEDEHNLFRELFDLAQAALDDPLKIKPYLPLAAQRARNRLRSGQINDLGFSPTSSHIAIGASGRKVILWDFHQARRVSALTQFERSIGALCYLQTGELVIAERTNSPAPCRLYCSDGQALTMLWQVNGPITALESAGGTTVLVAGRDHSLALLDVSARRVISENRRLAIWPRSVCVAPTSQRAALLHQGIQFICLPALEPDELTAPAYKLKETLRCATFSPQGDMLIAGAYNGTVWAMPVEKRRKDQVRRLTVHNRRVENVVFLGNWNIVLSAGSDAEIHFIAWANSHLLGKIQTTGKRLTSLHVSLDGNFMATGDHESGLSLWDLRVLELPALLDMPLLKSTPRHLIALQVAIEEGGMPERVLRSLKYLERVLRRRFRYDVEVSELSGIARGEFDIEIA